MLNQASRFTINKRVELERVIVQGRDVLRATVTDTGLPERLVIEADPNTDLPFHAIGESLEMGKWRIRQEHEFSYLPGLNVLKPDFTKTPVLTLKEARANFNNSMTATELGRLKLKDRTVIIRKIDVASDGTVFVAYQIGNMDVHRWNGSYISVADNQGTEYLQSGGASYDVSSEDSTPKEGRLELEIYIPVKPQKTVGNKLSLFVNCTESGKIDAISTAIFNDNGLSRVVRMHNGNEIAYSEWKGSKKKIIELTIVQPTCSVRPMWAGGIEWTMRNDVYAEIYKADKLAADAMVNEKWETAAKYLNDSLHWKRESEIQGFSGWDQGQTLNDLEKVRKHIQTK